MTPTPATALHVAAGAHSLTRLFAHATAKENVQRCPQCYRLHRTVQHVVIVYDLRSNQPARLFHTRLILWRVLSIGQSQM